MIRPDAPDFGDIQTLALDGFNTHCALHIVLQVTDAAKARRFLAEAIERQLLTFGPSEGSHGKTGVNVGFTRMGLQAIGVDDEHLETLDKKSKAFAAGAAGDRAARYLGDSGDSAVSEWEPAFDGRSAHVWLALHADEAVAIEDQLKSLRALPGAGGLSGWDDRRLAAAHLGQDRKDRRVHFGYRDDISRPTIRERKKPEPERRKDNHHNKYTKRPAGELLLGHADSEGVNYWSDEGTPVSTAAFLRGASFGVLRKIEQRVDEFEGWLEAKAAELCREGHQFVTVDYLKAKLCGRWPSGALVWPGATTDPNTAGALNAPEPSRPDTGDEKGLGCPFGAHIRRANPGADPVLPPGRQRVLFRRGMPYDKDSTGRRGLMGVFFCANLDDQFERLVSEWIEKMPMGLPDGGNAKDPLVGNNDIANVRFRIPLVNGRNIELTGWQPFVSTRGTLYALFPARGALQSIARIVSDGEGPSLSRGAGRAQGGADSVQPEVPDAGDAGVTPVDRFCDIVMEGGITSGIIYTAAVAKLSRHYRFQGISGASIGAFAAALTAAAEYRRRRGSVEGFDEIAAIPTTLAAPPEAKKTKESSNAAKAAKHQEHDERTLLERLFNPQPETRRLFAIFRASVGHRSASSALASGLVAGVRAYAKVWAIVGLVLTLLLLGGPLAAALLGQMPGAGPSRPWSLLRDLLPWIFALPSVWLIAIIGGMLGGILYDLLAGLVPNGFGLCRGWVEETSKEVASKDVPDLCGFLHASIQTVAGRDKEQDPPLTFRDLRSAPGSPAEVFGYGSEYRGPDEHAIELRIYSTNLAHSRPYRFPLDDPNDPDGDEDMGRLFFRPDEWLKFFPEGLVRLVQGLSVPYQKRVPPDPEPSPETAGYFELPSADLPVVVAVRMAMSFPGLISAIPVYAIDYGARKSTGRKLRRCWMSDGGLCSNFPIHLFDSWIPAWPTFGIALLSRETAHDGPAVWLPDRHDRGRADLFHHGLDDDLPRRTRLGSFLLSLWMAAWQWNDRTLMRMPGVRDRVVRVYLEPGEGGLNIRMTGDTIKGLCRKYGEPAADRFLERFADPQSTGWQEQRWVRFAVLLDALRERAAGLRRSALMNRHAVPLPDQIDAAGAAAPLRGVCGAPSEGPINLEQEADMRGLLAALEQLERRFERASGDPPYIPRPRGRLRLRHPT